MANDTAAAKRARKKTEKTSSVANLIAGLQFVLVAQKEKGEPRQTHCILHDKWVLASDGAIHAGCKIEDDISAVVHTRLLLKALQRAGEGQIAVVHLPSGKLSVRGGKFTGLAPCLPFDHVAPTAPDPKIANLTNEIKAGFAACVPLTNENSPDPRIAGILLQSMTCVGTNGFAIIEYWHGIDLPPGLVIPKAAAKAVADCPKNLTGFGFTDRSVTFHFEDESFIKSNLFESKYPDPDRLLTRDVNPWPIPADFFTALDIVKEFSDDHLVFFDVNLMKSSSAEGEGSTYEVQGLPGGMGFNEKYLDLCRHQMQRVHFDVERGEILFFSDHARGMVRGVSMGRTAPAAPVPPPGVPQGYETPMNGQAWGLANPDMEDDIPF